jgi:GT2 family glycosyltransferase
MAYGIKNISMKTSFIIASLDRDEELQECIASIERACDGTKNVDVEILVVFQGVEKNKDIVTRHPELTTFYYIKEKGLSVARNFAIKKSAGEYLVFIDDDAAVKEDFLEVLFKSIQDVHANAFCGKIVDPAGQVPFTRLFYNENRKSLSRFDFSYFMGSAHVLSRSVIEKTGGFDEEFGAGGKYPAAEESDMFFRLKRQGEKVFYLPELVFYHPINTVTSDIKCFNYSYAIGAVLAKQMFLDKRCLFAYLFIISEIILKTSIRTVQTVWFPKSIGIKNERFRYRSVLTGTIKGVCDYIKRRWIKSYR